ncbi:hydrogenase formation protein HypD [Clostridium polynesiense]|uniref:hydrogenase formation protein HypD n=1 Tax=Clostridium polynesiense TaxID=1325933 RepID=UPI000AE6879A|nr:hydrogenase formation protein HypD [Clostridium polynesiense]
MLSDLKKIIYLIEQNLSKIEKPNIMEVCGTHTMALSKTGIRDLFKNKINFISGPGCPVCVTHEKYIDYIYELSLYKDVIIATYGDMIRVPGTHPDKSLEKSRALGGNIKIVYSSMDALKLALENKNKCIVFLAIGFETTAPSSAVVIREACKRKIENFKILSMHRRIKPIMTQLLSEKDINIHSFLCPGHVAAVIGERGFKFLEYYDKPGVIAGFEREELLYSIFKITEKLKNKDYSLENCYKSIVRPEGNTEAVKAINETFTAATDCWRGIGEVRDGALKLKEEFREFDIEHYYPMKSFEDKSNENLCACGEILKGKLSPLQCPLFRKKCNPLNPIGPCMVSQEGSCAAYYRYCY